MKNINKLIITLRDFTSTIIRFHISILFFFLSAILTAYNISKGDFENYVELLLAFMVGATVFLVLQLIYEHFMQGTSIHLIFCGSAILAAIIYYLLVRFAVKEFSSEHVIRTIVLLFVLFITFMWIPAIKSKIGFSESFMAVFKSFFTVFFYSGVLFLGISLILVAIDMLIVNVDYKVYSQAGNLIVFIYAPIHFLSLIPIYPPASNRGRIRNNGEVNDLSQELRKAIEPSKFLGGLISYIAIPITAIYTIILLLYIVLNITGDFWKDNLMEPLLVTYSIIVIIVYLLASVIPSKIARSFRKIFPKVLIPVVLFQTLSSILKIGELGITSGRYYVILFGIFATISAILFSIRPNHKNNIIAPILIVLSLISIFPPVDAFRVSKANQIDRLTQVLEENEMLRDGKIIPNNNLSEKDKQIIISSVRYLRSMNHIKDISWLKSYSMNYDFEKTFGFSQYGSVTEPRVTIAYHYNLPKMTTIDISGYDFFVEAEFFGDNNADHLNISFVKDKTYTLYHEAENDIGDLVLKDEEGNELIRYSLGDIFESFKGKEDTFGELALEDAQFMAENNNGLIYIVTRAINYEEWNEEKPYQNINAYVMVKIK
ncbi:MAG: DUF4153 domain-containing protein [Clostridiales bacterium]|nr:DUF4153 domain-containing protein [Clostridiales bacterium]